MLYTMLSYHNGTILAFSDSEMPEYRVYAELALISLSLCLGVLSLCFSDWITIENPVKTG